jgi:ornithine cyclodeaminase/alanine dehydrogenase-like protein (mu-crystallin family)
VTAGQAPRADARPVGIFGAGAQARTPLVAACAVRAIERATVCDPRARFTEEMGRELGVPIAAAEEITLFKLVGLAVEDVATAGRVYSLARAAGIGREIEI